MLFAPAILAGRLLVIDDIERKHQDLHIDEVLGFIDDFTQRHGARFLLILNSDQLDNKAIWERMREKVIDQELRLTTSPTEAFQIAVKIRSSPWADAVGEAIERCGITNIRIIQKVIRVTNEILAHHGPLSALVGARVIPSIVLLAAIHYKGIEDGPDLQYVLMRGRDFDWSYLSDRPPSEDEAKHALIKAGWDQLLANVGVYSADAFELMVVDYLETGSINPGEIASVLEKFSSEHAKLSVSLGFHAFIHRIRWDQRTTNEALIEEAVDVVGQSALLDPAMVTTLAEILSGEFDQQALASRAVTNWIGEYERKELTDDDSYELRRFTMRALHPEIEQAFAQRERHNVANTSIVDTCIYLATNNGWGTRQQFSMKSATLEDMDAALRQSAIEDFRTFMIKMVELCVSKEMNTHYFGTAMDHFEAACRRIVETEADSRLATIIRWNFKEANLSL